MNRHVRPTRHCGTLPTKRPSLRHLSNASEAPIAQFHPSSIPTPSHCLLHQGYSGVGGIWTQLQMPLKSSMVLPAMDQWRSKGGKVEPGSPKFFRHPGLTWPVIHFNQLVDYQISWSKPRKLLTWSLSSNRISQIHIASSTNIEHTQYLWGMKHVHFFKIHGMESELSQIKLNVATFMCVNGFCFWLRTQLVFLHNAAEKIHQALQHRKTRLPTQRPNYHIQSTNSGKRVILTRSCELHATCFELPINPISSPLLAYSSAEPVTPPADTWPTSGGEEMGHETTG